MATTQQLPPKQSLGISSWSKSGVPFNKWGDAIAFGPEKTIVIAGKGTLLVSYDNGDSWKEILGGRGNYNYTLDGGATLKSSDGADKSSVRSISLKELCSVESAIVTPSGRLYLKATCEHTTQLWSIPLRNESEAWHILSFSYAKDPSDGVYTPGHDFVISGGKALISATLPSGPALLTTDNDGAVWHPLWRGSDDASGIIGVNFINDSQGWMLQGDGILSSTIDGGRTWKFVSKLSDEFARKAFSLSFANIKTGFIVGLNGLILKSNDGGHTWERQNSDSKFNLYKVVAGDAYRIWAIGGYGTVLQTIDGGVHWQKIELGIGKYLYFSLAVKNNVAWVISDQFMYHSPMALGK